VTTLLGSSFCQHAIPCAGCPALPSIHPEMGPPGIDRVPCERKPPVHFTSRVASITRSWRFHTLAYPLFSGKKTLVKLGASTRRRTDPRREGKISGCGVAARPTGALSPILASSGAHTPSILAGGGQILGDGAPICRGEATPAWLLGLDDTNADDEATSGRHSLPTLRGLGLSYGGSPFEQEQRGAPPRRIYIRALGAGGLPHWHWRAEDDSPTPVPCPGTTLQFCLFRSLVDHTS
jgi:hypothetical protein